MKRISFPMAKRQKIKTWLSTSRRASCCVILQGDPITCCISMYLSFVSMYPSCISSCLPFLQPWYSLSWKAQIGRLWNRCCSYASSLSTRCAGTWQQRLDIPGKKTPAHIWKETRPLRLKWEPDDIHGKLIVFKLPIVCKPILSFSRRHLSKPMVAKNIVKKEYK